MARTHKDPDGVSKVIELFPASSHKAVERLLRRAHERKTQEAGKAAKAVMRGLRGLGGGLGRLARELGRALTQRGGKAGRASVRQVSPQSGGRPFRFAHSVVSKGDAPAPAGAKARRSGAEPGSVGGSAGKASGRAAAHNLVVEHMWRRGLALDEISVRLAVPTRTLQSYLAAQAMRPEGPLVSAASLAATLAANVPAGIALRSPRRHRERKTSGICVALSHEETTCAGIMTGALSLLEGEMSLAPFVERACAAAERWRQTASKALRGIPASCQVRPSPRRAREVDRGVPDLSSLKAACEN